MTNEESLEERFREPEGKDKMQLAKEVAELYFQLSKDYNDVVLQKLTELRIIDDYRKNEYIAAMAEAESAKDPAYAIRIRMETVERIKRVVAFSIGRMISGEWGIEVRESPRIVIAYIKIGNQFLKENEQQ